MVSAATPARPSTTEARDRFAARGLLLDESAHLCCQKVHLIIYSNDVRLQHREKSLPDSAGYNSKILGYGVLCCIAILRAVSSRSPPISSASSTR